jgi:Tol biopolymer transport system component
VYTIVQKGQVALVQRHIATGRKTVLIPPQTQEIFACDITPDGRHLIYQRMDPESGFDIWDLPLDPAGAGASSSPASRPTLTPLVQSSADERTARMSPDGRWMAFVSNTSGVSEVYVQPFPGPGRRVQVSANGGDQPQWRSDGKELFYLAPDGKLTTVTVAATADAQSIEIGPPAALFVANAGSPVVLSSNYAATADGQRFLLNRVVGNTAATPIRVVLNWTTRSQAP